MTKILITGGAGYLGSILTPALLNAGYAVTVLDNFLFKQATLMECCSNSRFNVVKGDCRNKATLLPLVAKHDIILPLAAIVGAPLCNLDNLSAESTNFEAIRLLTHLCGSSQLIIYPTTNSGYGIGTPGKKCNEESPLNPISLYGITKVAAEKCILERPNSISFRLATVFGCSPRMRLDLLVNDFVYRAVNDGAVTLFEAHFKRNYIHIRDVARVFLHGIEKYNTMRGQAFNVGLDDANLSKSELCQKIKTHLPHFTYLEAPVGEDPDKRDYIICNQKLLATNFEPQFSLDDGIHELIKAFHMIKTTQYRNV